MYVSDSIYFEDENMYSLIFLVAFLFPISCPVFFPFLFEKTTQVSVLTFILFGFCQEGGTAKDCSIILCFGSKK